jgi:dienelactone hydrolase
MPNVPGRAGRWSRLVPAVLAAGVLGGCASKPLNPYTADTPPLTIVPAGLVGVQDRRARFREIFCTVLKVRGDTLPDDRPCEDALTRVGVEPPATGVPVLLAPSRLRLVAAVVSGFGYDCIGPWLEPPGTVAENLRRSGFDLSQIPVEGLSSSTRNAELIRDALMAMPQEPGPPRLVLVGYSKGANDILEALVAYPELRPRVAAFVSVAGAIGGSALANDSEQDKAEILKHFPKSTCTPGDRGAVASLRPTVRQAWLAAHPLPVDVRTYTVATFPRPGRISSILKGSHDKLARIDARNDSQVIFYDEIVPGSALLAYLNADHWAAALPIARSHRTVGSLFVTQNAFPREALAEAILRFVEEDLEARTPPTEGAPPR